MAGRLLPVALAALALVAPTVQAQGGESTPTTLYFHVFDTFNKFPINTQPMDVDFFDVGGTNFPTIQSQGYDFNTIYGFSTSGPVEYDFIENGRPRFHPERGIARDVILDKNFGATAYLYFDVRDVFAGNDAPMVLPTLTVRVTMREGDALGDEAKLNDGKILMEGRVTAHLADVSAANSAVGGQTAPDGNPVLVPDSSGVVEVAIPMTISADAIPKADAYNVRIDWWQDPAGALGEDQFSTGWMRLVADPQHLPRLELAVTNPIAVDFLHPQVAAGILLVHAGVLSPWGTYDVDVANTTIEITGPSGPEKLEKVVAQHAHVHGHHDQAAELTWLWRFRDEGAADGDYSIRLVTSNLAGTATAEATAGFKVEGVKAYGVSETGEIVEPTVVEEPQESPTATAPLVALLVAGVGLAARRRRSP